MQTTPLFAQRYKGVLALKNRCETSWKKNITPVEGCFHYNKGTGTGVQ